MLDDDASHRLVRSIIDLAHSFNLEVVAEGVENETCAENLRRYGCDVLQGFLYSKPLSQPDFLDYLKHFKAPSA
jgi:EAL domain-containing protein (putative c-di-GMP-specific phosphodiesterase class I)